MVFDPDKPYGKNSFNSRSLFFNRKIYKNRSYLDDGIKPLDLWYERNNYGKIDKNADAIEVSSDSLKSISNNATSLNFVADAFEDLRIYMFKSGNKNKIKTDNTVYYEIRPKAGYVDLEQAYLKHTTEVYKIFVEFSKSKVVDESIVDFTSFLKVFSEFIDRITPKHTFTKSGFLLSNRCSPLVSGLVIEVDSANHGDDENKYNKYINDVNFRYFQDAALRHGFVIDKNAPWRLVADLGSKTMQEYMSRYELSVDNVLQKVYTKVSKVEIDSMKRFLARIYNIYASEKPMLKMVEPSGDSLCCKFVRRAPVTSTQIQNIDEMVWLKYYAYVRSKEVGYDWDQKTFDSMIKVVNQLYKFKGYDAAHAFVVTNTKGVHREKDSLTKSEKYDTIRGDFHKQSTFQPFKLL